MVPIDINVNTISEQISSRGMRENNVIIIELENEVVGQTSANFKQLLTVESSLYISGEEVRYTYITPSLVTVDGKDVIYHYMVYDLCHLDATSRFSLRLTVNQGKFIGKVTARIDRVKKFSVICPEADSDFFEPRQNHGACTTWDEKLYVFGGQRVVDGQVEYMNDIIKFDQLENRWICLLYTSPSPRD